MWALCWFLIYFLFLFSNVYLFVLPFFCIFPHLPLFLSFLFLSFKLNLIYFFVFPPPPFSLFSLLPSFRFSFYSLNYFSLRLFFSLHIFTASFFSFFLYFFLYFLFYISPYFCVFISIISIISQFILFIFSVYFYPLSSLFPFHFFSQPSFLFHSFSPQKP